MRNGFPRFFLVALFATVAAGAEPPRHVCDFALSDATGTTYRQSDFAGKPVVFVISAPTLGNRNEQEAWGKVLSDLMESGAIRVVFLEDLSPSWFEEVAKRKISQRDKPDQEPIVLLDDDGSVRKCFNVPEGKTMVLVYSAGGQLVRAEHGGPKAASKKRIRNALAKDAHP